MKKDYYKILDVNKNFTEDELKKQYKKMCLRYHPDRLAGKSEEEKKAAEEKFKDVQEAYECLSDKDKKSYYDNHGSMEGYGQGWSDGADMFSHFSSFFDDFPGFGNFFGGGRRSGRHNSGPEPGQSLRIQVGVNIKELLDGGKKKLQYVREVRCHDCNGTGGSGVETCSHCHGTGMLTTSQQTPFGFVQNSRPCPYCEASGKIIKNACKKCGGSGLVKETTSIEVTIPQGCQNGATVVMNGAGCDSKTSGAPAGDLQVIFLHQYDKDKFYVQGNIIYEKINVPYYDALLGRELNHTAPNGHKIHCTLKQCVQDGDNIHADTINGYDYRFIISIVMPNKINDTERKLLEKIRNEHR